MSDSLRPPWTAAHQASLSITNSRSLLKLMFIESVMPSNHLILCHPLLLPPSVFPSIRVFLNEPVLHIRWPKYGSFSFSISPSSEYSGLVGAPCSPRDSQESSPTPQLKIISLSALSLLYGVSSVQSLSHAQLSATPWTAACQASLSITIPGACSNLGPSGW